MQSHSTGKIIAVFGSSTVAVDSAAFHAARTLGRLIAEAGAAVMSGGYGGVMDAVSRGARAAGGTAIGVTVAIPPGRTPTSALTREIRTPDLLARLRTLVYEPAGFVVLESSLGTLTEMFLAWTLLATGGRPEAPLVLLGDRWTGFLHDLTAGGHASDAQL